MHRCDPVPIVVVGDFLDNGKIYAFEEVEGTERMVLLDLKLERRLKEEGILSLAEILQSGGSVRNQRFCVYANDDGNIVSWSVLAKDAQPEVSV